MKSSLVSTARHSCLPKITFTTFIYLQSLVFWIFFFLLHVLWNVLYKYKKARKDDNYDSVGGGLRFMLNQ